MTGSHSGNVLPFQGARACQPRAFPYLKYTKPQPFPKYSKPPSFLKHTRHLCEQEIIALEVFASVIDQTKNQ